MNMISEDRACYYNPCTANISKKYYVEIYPPTTLNFIFMLIFGKV